MRERAKQQAERDFVSRIHPIDGVEHLKSEMQQALRDAPADSAINSANNTDELKAQWNTSILGPSPYN